MGTYKEIQEYIKYNYEITVKTCWIAHMKEECGLKRRDSYNRKDPKKRMYPCPNEKQGIIIEAFKYFNMI